MSDEFIPPKITDERFAEIVKEYKLDITGSGRGGKKDKNKAADYFRPGRVNVDPIWIVGAPGCGKTTLSENCPEGYVYDLDWVGTKDSKGHWYVHPDVFRVMASIHPIVIGVCSNWEELAKFITPRVFTKPDDFLRAVYRIRNTNPKSQGGYKFGEKEIEFQKALLSQYKAISKEEVQARIKEIQDMLTKANENNTWRTEKGFPLLENTGSKDEPKPKAFKCPHCGQETTKHYHQKDGKDVACLKCLNRTEEQFEKDKQSAESKKHNFPGKDHATYPDEWPFKNKDLNTTAESNEEILKRQVEGTGKAPIFKPLPIMLPIEPNQFNKEGNPYKLGVVKGSEERKEDPDNMMLLKVREESYEVLSAKTEHDMLYEFVDVVVYAEVIMDDATPVLKDKLKGVFQEQLEKNVARGRAPRRKIREALGLTEVKMDKPEDKTLNKTKDDKLADELLGKKEVTVEAKPVEPIQDVTTASKDATKNDELITSKEPVKPGVGIGGAVPEVKKPEKLAVNSQSFGIKRTGVAGKKFEI